MRRFSQLAVCLLALFSVPRLSAGEVVDRIIATVNGVAILESEWDETVRFECFLEQKPLASVTPADLKASLERLIDQTLIQQQMQASKFVALSPQEARQRVNEIHQQARRNFLAQSPPMDWLQALANYSLTEQEFERRATLQVETLRFVDLRFRPGIRIDNRKVETYYREKLLPEMQRNGAKETPLAEISPKIQELLVQQTMDEMLTAWLRDLRAQSEVVLR